MTECNIKAGLVTKSGVILWLSKLFTWKEFEEIQTRYHNSEFTFKVI